MQIVESVYFRNITFNRKIPLYSRLIPLVTGHMERIKVGFAVVLQFFI